EEDRLYQQFKLDEPWDSPHNITLLPRLPRIYAPVGKQPNTNIEGGTYLQMIVGANTVHPAVHLGLPIMRITDGISNTIHVVEAGDPVPWTKPDDISFDPRGAAPLPKLGAIRPDGFYALLCDGAVRFIDRAKTSERTIRLAIDPNDGQGMPADW